MPDNKPKKIDFDALKSSVYSYDKLQSQYGGQRFATRGAALSKERYNAAWEEYSKANPDAKKENFRNIYTTKAKDEENLTPWQQRARKDVQEAAALAEEDKASFRSKQQENFAGLDPEQRQIRGKKALQALQSLGGTKTDEIKKILKQVGSGPGVQRNRDLTDDEFAKVQSFLESRSGTAYADDANQILQGLYKQSPMKRYESPFKRKLDIQQGPNYADLSARIGQSVNSAIEEQRIAKDRAAEEERRAAASEMQQIQLARLKADQYESLNTKADTGIPSADTFINRASRQLVDKQAKLVAELKNNDIDTDKFAEMSALLKSQVPLIGNAKKRLTDFQNNYTNLLSTGQLSASNNGDAAKLYNAMLEGKVEISQNENGSLAFKDTSGEIDIDLSKIDRLPTPTPKAQPLNILVKDVAAGFADRPTWDDSSSEAVKAQLDNMLGGGTDLQAQKTLKAIAVDSLGISLEKANELLNSPIMAEDGTVQESDDSGNTNQLEQMVEQRMVEEAKSQWEANKFKREKEQNALALQEARLAQLQRAANQDPQAVAKLNAENQQNFVTNMVNNKDLGSLVGQGGAATVAADPKGNPRVQYLLNSQGKPVFSVDWGKPNEAYNRIQNFLRAKERGEYQDPHEGIYPTTAPFKKKSPFRRLVDWVSSPFKNEDPGDLYLRDTDIGLENSNLFHDLESLTKNLKGKERRSYFKTYQAPKGGVKSINVDKLHRDGLINDEDYKRMSNKIRGYKGYGQGYGPGMLYAYETKKGDLIYQQSEPEGSPSESMNRQMQLEFIERNKGKDLVYRPKTYKEEEPKDYSSQQQADDYGKLLKQMQDQEMYELNRKYLKQRTKN